MGISPGRHSRRQRLPRTPPGWPVPPIPVRCGTVTHPSAPPGRARYACLLPPLAIVVLLALGMDAPDPVAVPVASEPRLQVVPYLRVEVLQGGERRIALPVVSRTAATLLASEADCACVALIDQLPRALPVGTTTLTVRVAGLLPGTKKIVLRTTAGTIETVLQVAVPGHDTGLALLDAALAAGRAEDLHPVLLVHDLRGRLRNCGCAEGSLGGADHLAALPALLRARGIADGRCLLTGDIDGGRPELQRALVAAGWEARPPDIAIVAEAGPELAADGVLAVVPAAGAAADPSTLPNHQRIVRPILDGGAVAMLLLVDAGGRLVRQVVIPIDRSLPADPALLAALPEPRTITVRAPQPAASTACAPCHAQAHAAWQASAHARAFTSLPAEARTDACVTCHSSPIPSARPTLRDADVGCIACHTGASEHAAAPATVRTTGTTDCRGCHDALHHPGFDPISGWERIRHKGDTPLQ